MKSHSTVLGIGIFLLVLAIVITWGWFRFFSQVEQHVRGNTTEYAEYADSMVGKMFTVPSQFAGSSSQDLLGSFGSTRSTTKVNTFFAIEDILGVNRVYAPGSVQMSPSFTLLDIRNKKVPETNLLVKVSIEDRKSLKIFSQTEATYDGLNNVWESTLLQNLPLGRYRLVIQASCMKGDTLCIQKYGDTTAMEFVEFAVK